MASIILLDNSPSFVGLVARHLEDLGGHLTLALTEPSTVVELAGADRGVADILVVEPLTPGSPVNGVDALLAFAERSPETSIVLLTASSVPDDLTLAVVWDAVRPASAVSKGSPLEMLERAIDGVIQRGSHPPDPRLGLIDAGRPATRRAPDSYRRLVPHRGHAKLWSALLASTRPPTYRTIAERTDLKVNTIRNYRDDLLAELANWGLESPSMREMHRFAWAARPLLTPFITERLTGNGAASRS